jgi:hypothetical protein
MLKTLILSAFIALAPISIGKTYADTEAAPPNVTLPMKQDTFTDQTCVFWATQAMYIQQGRQIVEGTIGIGATNKHVYSDFIKRVFVSIERQEITSIMGQYLLQTGEYVFKNIDSDVSHREVGNELFLVCKDDLSVIPTFMYKQNNQI